MDQSQRVLEQLTTRSLGSNPAQGQAAQGMSVVGGAQQDGSATSSSTERPSDTIVVCLPAHNAKLRTQQRSQFKSLLRKKGIPCSMVKFQQPHLQTHVWITMWTQIRQKLPLVVRYGIVIAWVARHSSFSRVSDAVPHVLQILLKFIV